MTNTFLWAEVPWDDPAWETYIPTPDAPTLSSVRIGQFALERAQGFPSLPALAPFVGSGSLFITSTPDTVAAAQQLLQRITLRLVVSSPPGPIRLNLADPLSQGSTLTAFYESPACSAWRSDLLSSGRCGNVYKRANSPRFVLVEVMVSNELGNTFPLDQTLWYPLFKT